MSHQRKVGQAAGTPGSGPDSPDLTEKSARPPRPVWIWVVAAAGVLMFLLGGAGGSYQGKLASVQKNDNSAFLPASAESTKAQNESDKFNPTSTIPGSWCTSVPVG